MPYSTHPDSKFQHIFRYVPQSPLPHLHLSHPAIAPGEALQRPGKPSPAPNFIFQPERTRPQSTSAAKNRKRPTRLSPHLHHNSKYSQFLLTTCCQSQLQHATTVPPQHSQFIPSRHLYLWSKNETTFSKSWYSHLLPATNLITMNLTRALISNSNSRRIVAR